ncbi:MAG TPA: bacteriohemerythrin [Bryobacteraceae bacterium]|nr:bacteriohemerythrin [Bryobacteraceae bacterium]
MQKFEWSARYSVGIPEIDAEHRRLVELLGEFAQFTSSGDDSLASTMLRKLQTYAERHLQREELLLRVRGYPEYAAHKAEHDAYRKKVASLQLDSARHDIGIRIANFLIHWWKFHILTADQEYARFFRALP